MNSQISPKYYYSKEIFEKEQNNIFSKTWVFAGFSHDFENVQEVVEYTDQPDVLSLEEERVHRL